MIGIWGIYEGEVVNGTAQGFGRMITKDSTVHIGEYRSGVQVSGYGVFKNGTSKAWNETQTGLKIPQITKKIGKTEKKIIDLYDQPLNRLNLHGTANEYFTSNEEVQIVP